MDNSGTVYDDIANSWHSFKRKPFPPIVNDLAKDWKGKILDIGCGNGRNLLVFDGELTGIDNSKEMVEIARKNAASQKKGAAFLIADATKLPFKDGHFDYVLCIAMLHHIPIEKQKVALDEIKRVLKPQGKVLLTVWNKWQRRFLFGPKERHVPWTTNGKTMQRYYYLHNSFSLRKIVKEAEFTIESSIGTFGANVILILRK